MSARGNWGKSEFQLRRKAFERKDGTESGGASEDEAVSSGRR